MVDTYSDKVLGKSSNYFSCEGHRRFFSRCISGARSLLLPWVKRCLRRARNFSSSHCTWAPFSSPPCVPSPSRLSSLPSFRGSWQPAASSRSGYYGSVLLRPMGCGTWGVCNLALTLCQVLCVRGFKERLSVLLSPQSPRGPRKMGSFFFLLFLPESCWRNWEVEQVHSSGYAKCTEKKL